jgi:hypothetical protein
MIMTVNSLTGRLCKQEKDKWGRWTSQVYQGQSGRKVAIISAYQPIYTGEQVGKITVAAQHISLLIQSGDTVLNPRVAFRRDLAEWLKDYQTKGYEILLTGDFNEPLGNDPEGMSKIAGDFKLMDLMASRHSSQPPATYARGTQRLDYALASAGVCKALQRAGYEPFNYRIATDHRGYFLDFNTSDLFGSDTQSLANRASRELSSSNHQQVTAYIRRKYEILTACNAFDRAAKLCHLGDRHAFAERLDKDITAASLTAEKDLPKFGAPAWSVALACARRKVLVLTKHLSSLKTGLDHRSILQHDVDALEDSTFELPLTIPECSTKLRVIKQEIKELIATSTERRDQELKRKLAELELSTASADKKMAEQLRRIKKAEDLKNLFRKLKYVRTTQERKGVTRIEIPRMEGQDPKECTDWVQVDVPTEVLRLLQQRNRKHFGQAFGTPFTIPPLYTHLGFDGASECGQQILDGQYDTSQLDSNVQLLINHMQQVHEIHKEPSRPTITEGEFREKLKVWTESTTTSPSGLHLGHYKTLIARHSFTTDLFDDELTLEFKQQRDELNQKQQALFQLHLNMINYALERGYSYLRWQTIANTILFKDSDNVRLHRTRVIHIYEADFNLSLGVKWRVAMHQAEDFQALNDGQYGSRANRCATDPVFIEELQCEISRATRKPVILTNYDATACYDRIIPNLGMLASRKYGVPIEVTRSNAATLSSAEYRVRTELGLAPTGYRHEESFPIYGTGQGSANSPAIWCFLSSSLFDCYDTVVHPATYQAPGGSTPLTLGMIGFVDDCNGQTNSFADDGSLETLRTLITQTKANAQAWNDLLTASGGALEVSKCSCHILQWIFSPQGAPMLVPYHGDLQSELTVRDDQTNTIHPLQLLSTHTAHKTLGHYKSPVGNQTEQFKQLKKKSDEITAFLWTCPLSRLEAWTYYFACYLPSVGYPLACSSLTKTHLETIQMKAMSIIVARCGFNRHTKKEILYGPFELGGANFRSLYVQQGVGQVTTFLKHWRQHSTAGNLLRIAVAWFQIQVGVSYSILENVKSDLTHLESVWIGSLRNFMADTGLSFHLDEPAIPKLQRQYDVYLMDGILGANRYTASEIRRLNYCRLYLKAITLADISDVRGQRLDNSKLEGAPSLISSVTHGNSIYQEKPSETAWTLWRRACRALWSKPDGTLNETLGHWTLPMKQHRQQHHAYYQHDFLCECDHILWIRVQEVYVRCIPMHHQWLFLETTQVRQWIDLPSDADPAAVELVGTDLWQLIHSSEAQICPFASTLPASTFEEFVSRLPPWEAELLQYFELPVDPFTVSDALSHGIKAVSDGSVWTDNQGAYGWMISTDTGDRTAKGMGPARGAKVDSYRAEAYGMLAILRFLRRLAEFTTQMEPWTGILATDSLSLLDTITDKPTESTPGANKFGKRKRIAHLDVKCPEWDLVSSILVELERWPGLQLQHVRGHQDRKTAYDRLPLLAQLNVDADTMATVYQCEHGMARPIVLLTDTAGVHLVTPKGSTTSQYDAVVRYQATYPALFKYIQERNGWSSRVMQNVNWQAHGASLRKKLERKTHYLKLVHGILPTGSNLHRTDPIRSRCPLCQAPNEDWYHIVRCPHHTRESWRVDTVHTLKKKCTSLQTRPFLTTVLCDALSGWLRHDSEHKFQLNHLDYPSPVHRLIHQQNEIGWQQLFLGRFTKEWADLQDNYYARKRAEQNDEENKKTKKMTGHRWQVTIIGILWDQWWAVWESRNKDLHGADAKSRANAESREVHRTLRDLYDMRHRLDPHVQACLYDNVADHYNRTTWFNQNWIAIHEPMIRANMKQIAVRTTAGVRSIRQFLVSLIP